jgi:hypothetical protein
MWHTLKDAVRHVLFSLKLDKWYLWLRRAKGENLDHLYKESLQERFSTIYRNMVWRNGRECGSLSGLGSELESTLSIREKLPLMVARLEIKSLLDVGCGDFTWMQAVKLPATYIGVDVVREVIDANSRAFESPSRRFHVVDATRDSLPQADALLCREVLFHLSYQDIKRVLEKIKGTDAKYLLATTDTAVPFNRDIRSGDFRRLNLQKPPFSFPEPAASMPDGVVARGRVLAVWEVAAIP